MMVIDSISTRHFPDFGTMESLGIGAFGIYLLRERSSWGYWLAMLYAAGAFASGLWTLRGSGFFNKGLGVAETIFGLYFMMYFFSRREFFD